MNVLAQGKSSRTVDMIKKTVGLQNTSISKAAKSKIKR